MVYTNIFERLKGQSLTCVFDVFPVPPGETTSPISDNVKDNMCLKPDTLPAKPSTTQATTQLPPQHALSRAVNVVNIHNVIYSGALSVSNSPGEYSYSYCPTKL